MKILRLNDPPVRPRVSLVLVDWSVRESFHIIDYLQKQSVPRDSFEIIIIEFFDRVSPALEPYRDEVDSWILLQVPESCYYHKHVMYNAGIVAACGDIVMIGDSDAMVRETFIEAIAAAFDDEPEIVLHLDQYRNNRRDLYPFNKPSFDDILGEGCVNDAGGVTAGIRDEHDPLHTRNYGACMSARRDDLIAIGGADEHIDFVGHICGPYDLTFRLVNQGRKEIWHESEFTFHSWHPGASGVDNYQGPHDGKQMSSTSLEALFCGRTRPLLENAAIGALRTGKTDSREDLLGKLLNPADFDLWQESKIVRASKAARWSDSKVVALPSLYRGPRIEAAQDNTVRVTPLGNPEAAFPAPDAVSARRKIDRLTGLRSRLAGFFGAFSIVADRVWEKLIREIFNRSGT